MSEGHHDLIHEFPEFRQEIHVLKLQDERFAELHQRYHQLCKELHRIESGIDTPGDDYVNGLKRERVQVKDRIASLLRQHAGGQPTQNDALPGAPARAEP